MTRSSRSEHVRSEASGLVCVFVSFQFPASCPCARLFCIGPFSCFFFYIVSLSAPCHLHVRYKVSGLPRAENASFYHSPTKTKINCSNRNSNNSLCCETEAWQQDDMVHRHLNIMLKTPQNFVPHGSSATNASSLGCQTHEQNTTISYCPLHTNT